MEMILVSWSICQKKESLTVYLDLSSFSFNQLELVFYIISDQSNQSINLLIDRVK